MSLTSQYLNQTTYKLRKPTINKNKLYCLMYGNELFIHITWLLKMSCVMTAPVSQFFLKVVLICSDANSLFNLYFFNQLSECKQRVFGGYANTSVFPRQTRSNGRSFASSEQVSLKVVASSGLTRISHMTDFVAGRFRFQQFSKKN